MISEIQMSSGLFLAAGDGIVPIIMVGIFVAAWAVNAYRAAQKAANKKNQAMGGMGNRPQMGNPQQGMSLDEMLRQARDQAAARRNEMGRGQQGNVSDQPPPLVGQAGIQDMLERGRQEAERRRNAALQSRQRSSSLGMQQMLRSGEEHPPLMSGQVPPSLHTMLPNPMPTGQSPAPRYKPPGQSAGTRASSQQMRPMTPTRRSKPVPPQPKAKPTAAAPRSAPVMRASDVPETEVPAAGTRPVDQSGPQAGSTKPMPAVILGRLQDARRVREAFVLSEILQSPVAMRNPLERDF